MNSYDEILQSVHECQIMLNTNSLSLFYRGHADKDWKLVPTISRETHSGVSEKNIIDTAIKRKQWQLNRSLFENIAYLQHYGSPTRFLDYSTDVDIALFFACCGHEDKDGVISVCTYTNDRGTHSFDSTLIAELALLENKTSMQEFCLILMSKYPELKDVYSSWWERLGMDIIVWLDHGFMVVPSDDEYVKLKEWNKRLFNQKGTFFVFGNKTEKPIAGASTIEARNCIILPELATTPNIINHRDYAKKIPVRKEAKAEILDILAQKGISNTYIYPD